MTVFMVIDFNFAKAYRNGPSSIFKNMTVFMSLILILRRFTMGLLSIFKSL